MLLFDNTIESSFYHVFDYLYLSGRNGITQNPIKFRFCQKEIEFAGFLLGWDSFRPSDGKLSSIKNYTMPDQPSITDFRSWFGLVNQLSPFVALTPLMEPFRELLKPSLQHKGKAVFWNEEMQIKFEQTKEKICSLIHDGLTFFDASKPTACVTDWSKKGIGFAIVQKHCNCPSLFCCNSGWKLTFCGSRHLSEAELNYAPIEGEALL